MGKAWAPGTKSEFLAAVHLIGDHWFSAGHFDLDGCRVDWDSILSVRPALSDGERVLVDLALALWSGRMKDFDLGEAMRRLDDENFQRMLEAMQIRRGLDVAVTA